MPTAAVATFLGYRTSGTTTLTGDTSVPPSVPGNWGGIPAANWTVTFNAFNATGVDNGLGAGRLPGQTYNPATDASYAAFDLSTWGFFDPVWQTVLSDSGFTNIPGLPSGGPRSAFDLLNIGGPIYDTVGQLIATDKADLFDGTIGAPLNHTEHGVPHTGTTSVWTGTTILGNWSADSCSDWNTASAGQTASIGRTDTSTDSWTLTNLLSCNSSARLYAISPLFTIPQPGDFDGDGDVDGADFLAWQRTDGTAAGLNEWQNNFGAVAPIAASTIVPEPSTLLLALLLAITVPSFCRRNT